MPFKIIYHFMGEKGVLRAIRPFDDLVDDSATETNTWQWIPYGYTPITLVLRSEVGNTLKFEGGSLKFDQISGVFIFNSSSFRLNRVK